MLVRLKELKDELAYKDATILEIKCNSLRLELQLEEKEKDLKTIGEIKTDMLAQFKNISNEIVEIQKENFTREQKRDLASILDPLKKQISDFDLRVQRTIQDNNESTAKTEAALREHIGLLVKHTENVGVKADNLANVLRNDRKAQGNFGELQLENLLESIGLREGTDYLKQQYVKNREGEQFFLDFLINMPGQRKLVIDSKVSLVNYENYRGT
ncbi:MAG: DNA recombination protein RmuC, partial [Rickettsiales bacterium]|nr:DNA recombination protein RmuC [Rickettsiales bacterium]